MRHGLIALALLSLASLALAQRNDYGQPFSISGIPILEELPNAPVSAVTLENRKLGLEVGSVHLMIAPLPSGLERFPFTGSTVQAERRDHPDGPETRLEFRATNGQALALGSQMARRSLIVANWRFDSNVGTSFARVRLENRSTLLKVRRTATLRGTDGTWCVRLVALHIPQAAKPGVALEAEGPRFDWTAIPANTLGRCAAP
jgi:hypothetical protein